MVTRYHIYAYTPKRDMGWWLLGTSSTKEEAFAMAEEQDNRSPGRVRVYDSMARIGSTQSWQRESCGHWTVYLVREK
jgi:hypothetical protein